MTRKHLLVVVALALLLFIGARAEQLSAIAAAPRADVLIAFEPGSAVQAQWDAKLRRQGVPHEWVSVADFGVLDGGKLAQRFAVIVIPRAISRTIPDAARAQFAEFAAAGGRVVIK